MAFLHQQLIFYRHSLSQSERDLQFGELSIFWKVMVMIIRVRSHRESSSSWLISWNKKRKEKHNPDGISGRLQE